MEFKRNRKAIWMQHQNSKMEKPQIDIDCLPLIETLDGEVKTTIADNIKFEAPYQEETNNG